MATSTSPWMRPLTAASVTLFLVVGAVTAVHAARADAAPLGLAWRTVVNNGDLAPGSNKTFNAYNAPSVNTHGTVVFRGHTKGEQQPVRGVFTRDAAADAPIVPVAVVGGAVPQPNNSGGVFNEFPSFPRIDMAGPAVVSRGQSTPVWTTQVDGVDTKVGTSGVYTTAGGSLTTGASLLGAVPGYGRYAVPGAPAGTRFDQFPSSPSVDGTTIVFKGNFTEGTTGRTGDYFRDVSDPAAPIERIADTSTLIPNQPAGGTATFGATAPPSAAGGRAVFTAWDNEDAPTRGGVYLADLSPDPVLRTLVGIGEPVPPELGSADTFTNFGEGLSFDGRYVAFWATWGSQTRTITLTCPDEGNADRNAFCAEQHPDGYTTTVPTHQGLFLYDTATDQLHTVATTGARFLDFLFWVFSGHAPGNGGVEDGTMELARWRSSAFVAVSATAAGGFQVAFKASPDGTASGIYLSQGPGARTTDLLATSAPATVLDPEAPAGSLLASLSVERDGFRGRWLAVNATMVNTATGAAWAGIYLAQVPDDATAQTITMTSMPPARSLVGTDYAPAATASSGLPVEFSIDPVSDGTCTLDGALVRFASAGTCVLDADQPGDDFFAAAPRVQQAITVSRTLTTLVLTPSASRSVYGQPVSVSAALSAERGAPSGTVRFALDGAALGAPVAASPTAPVELALSTGGAPLPPGAHVVTARFDPDDPVTFAPATGTLSHVVSKAGTTLSLVVGPHSVTATVAAVAPGAGTPTGRITFTVEGRRVGSASLQRGVARLAYTVAPGRTRAVAAAYPGDVRFSGTSGSTARRDPVITARLTSRYPVSRAGWYRAPVTVSFACAPRGAALATRCPAAVRLTRSAAAQTLTRTILAVDGGAATVVVRVNIDRARPALRVTGVRNGGVYTRPGPAPGCIARDALSGVLSCRVSRTTVGEYTTFRAVATDRAGNVTVRTGRYRTLSFFVAGARYRHGSFVVQAGRTYSLIAYARTRPTFYDAAVYPRQPQPADMVMYRAGHDRWALGVTMDWSMRAHRYWNLGVRVGSTMHLIRIRVG